MTALVVRELSVRVAGRLRVEGATFELGAGELAVLLGPNGAGKSTLLRALLGELPAESGEVTLLGGALSAFRPFERARAITLVPQEQPVDFPLTVEELVGLGRLPHSALGSSAAADRRAVRDALERTDLLRLRERDVASLSGGERQRASLARALAQRTPVLLLDEPTAHLDIGQQIAALEIVRELVQGGAAALIALHDLGLASRFADRVHLLERGRLVMSGPPGDVLTPEQLERSFAVRALVERDAGRIRHVTVLGRSGKEGAVRC